MYNFFLYLLGTVFSCYIAILYKNATAVSIFVMLLLLPVFSVCLAFYFSRQIQFSLSVPVTPATKGGKTLIQIGIHNTGALPITNVSLLLILMNHHAQNPLIEHCQLSCRSYSSQRYTFAVKNELCTKTEVSLASIRIYDYLHIISFTGKTDAETAITVLPALYDTCIEISDSIRLYSCDSEQYHPHLPGDDASEIFNIREYQPGDKIQRIHWKRSVHADTLMVKEFGMPLGCAVVFFLDFYSTEKALPAVQYSLFIETISSLSFGLTEAFCPHYIVWYDGAQKDLIRCRVSNEEELYFMVDQVMQVSCFSDKIDCIGLYGQKFRSETYHTSLILDLSLTLQKNGMKLHTFSTGLLKEDLQSLTIVI